MMADDNEALAAQKALDAQREVAYYGALVAAWVETRMEFDKTLLSLSTGGIGLLVTLLTTVGPSSNDVLICYGVAGALFVLVIAGCMWVFHRNAEYLESVVRNPQAEDDQRLQDLDAFLPILFGSGVAMTLALALVVGASKMHK
jgi:hypothetical protein